MPLCLRLLAGSVVSLAALTACADDPAPALAPSATQKFNCSAPPPLRDIWALEPALIRSGRITGAMNHEEREHAIRAYIAETNQSFLKKCKEHL